MSKAPSFPLYPADIIRDTRILSLEARGAWCDFLFFAHSSEHRGKLTYTISGWARLWGCDVATAQRCINEIKDTNIGNVTICNDDVTIINRRMVKEEKIKEQTKLRVRRHRETHPCNAVETPMYSAPSFSSSLESKILEDSLPSTINPTFVERGVSAKTETPSVAPKKDKPKRASQMPADFSLTPQMEAYARAKGLDGDIAMVWERFVLHHQSKGTTMMDWNKAWMKWVLNEIKFAGRANGGYPAKQLANDARERKPLTKEQIEELVS